MLICSDRTISPGSYKHSIPPSSLSLREFRSMVLDYCSFPRDIIIQHQKILCNELRSVHRETNLIDRFDSFARTAERVQIHIRHGSLDDTHCERHHQKCSHATDRHSLCRIINVLTNPKLDSYMECLHCIEGFQIQSARQHLLSSLCVL